MDKGKIFRDLHRAGAPFIIPNPWDVGTAKLLASCGFRALATTSAGFAFSRGLPDGVAPALHPPPRVHYVLPRRCPACTKYPRGSPAALPRGVERGREGEEGASEGGSAGGRVGGRRVAWETGRKGG